MTIDYAKLAAPFPAEDIEWRVQQCGEKGGKVWAIVLAYVTNRAIMERLDQVVGAESWRNEFTPAPAGGLLCGLSIWGANGWVTKWDGADNPDTEPVKGGLSNAMKRAAVQWGIGRYLYKLEATFATISDNGAHRGMTKENKVRFRWDPPALPAWALPSSEGEQRRPPARKAAAPSVAPSAASSAAEADVASSGDSTATAPSAASPALTTDVPHCPKCGGMMWDNRVGKRNPKAPDFKCRDRACDGVVWPPKPGEEPPPAGVKPGRQTAGVGATHPARTGDNGEGDFRAALDRSVDDDFPF